jgi:rhamnosyltransferase
MKILVSLSTYNGEKFLQEQLNSLFNQTYKVDILVRDDGSTDSTVQILKENSDRINYYCGENIGCSSSFLNLVKTASDDYDFYMFCDQDDFWLDDKVEKAVKKVQKYNKCSCVLYFSALNIANESLSLISKNINVLPSKMGWLTIEKSLLKSYGYGCTMLFSNKLKQLYSLLNYDSMVSHDWMMQKVALVFGKIEYDTESYIYYRQHQNNVIGFVNKRGIKSIIKSACKGYGVRSREAKLLLETYSDLIPINISDSIKKIAYSKKLSNRLYLLFSNKFKTNKIGLTLAIKIYSLLGLL